MSLPMYVLLWIFVVRAPLKKSPHGLPVLLQSVGLEHKIHARPEQLSEVSNKGYVLRAHCPPAQNTPCR